MEQGQKFKKAKTIGPCVIGYGKLPVYYTPKSFFVKLLEEVATFPDNTKKISAVIANSGSSPVSILAGKNGFPVCYRSEEEADAMALIINKMNYSVG